MNLSFGVWKSPTAISDEEAAARYLVLNSEKSFEPEFDAHVYTFYCRLTRLYPEIEMVPEDDLGSCPWACSLDFRGDHVIMAIQPEQCEKVVPQILALAEQHELVCFDAQAAKVHLPPHLRATKAATAVAFANVLELPSPCNISVTGVFEQHNLSPEPKKR